MKVRTIEREIGPFDVIEVPGDASGPVVILFHGYGADYRDLVPLAEVIEAPKGTTWIFPNAPLEANLGGGMWGRAWFPIDMNAIQKAMMQGTHKDMSSTIPEGLYVRREETFQFLKALNRPLNKIILGGFSQGSMLATDVAMHLTTNIAALVILSGNLIAESELAEAAPKHALMRFFQCHGRNDALLGFEGAQKLERLLVKSGLKGQLLPFTGGHEIPEVVTTAVGKFILKTFA